MMKIWVAIPYGSEKAPHLGGGGHITSIVIIIMKAKPKVSHKEFFSKFGILTLYSQYIFSTIVFVAKHKESFALNMEFHSINRIFMCL
jgi:hypothetical protein